MTGSQSSNQSHRNKENWRSSRDSRRRSASPRTGRDARQHSTSPRTGRNARRPSSPDPNKRSRQDFRSSASGSSLSACAVCLGRHPHRIVECKATKTWDNAADTICTRVSKVLTMRDGRPICSDWQRVAGCSDTTHDKRHFCSGCAASSHGVQTCARAQKA
ncbi:hypothetical protein DEU56DRAFT_746478 [Suillus clintonianus]|uniref:uncharacterized protein n=1 Tax=Suillus clintonianus TaxID=1904413 RepID=UPI001B86F956|nr:uncharacterized protein DEU56DRAFT_746478 [Suillus clintonianus]KAG2121742.1 hypothetical protein DEU56DRAFT_746478 [Suillus clintonianus]